MNNQHTTIAVPFPDAMERHLWISVGACRLRITRGGSEWVTGTYDDPTDSLPCHVSQEGGSTRITQQPQMGSWRGWGRGVPTFELALGTALPYSLTIETGASDSIFDLGGLPLTRLAIKLGAGKSEVSFREPNPQPMSVLDLDAGAGSLEVRSLANANFADMTLDGGAAAFTCDFSGALQRDAAVHISTGMAAVEILIPTATAARVQTQAVLGHVEASAGFTFRDGQYWSSAGLAGGRPLVAVQANVALGTLALRATEVRGTSAREEPAVSGV